ncbi:MAG: F0F1 ATP synthase subunit epsilon [Rhodobacteraceae bacterium]|nr:F0F1 ATP synthase subunit epsilon [Paracoccaceae bacterium]
MADTMQFDLVSPERKLASVQAESVSIPASMGDMVAMPNHAPVITTLRPGYVSVVAGGETTDYLVTGGFAEISAEGISVLAENALPKSEVTKEVLEEFHRIAEEDAKDVAEHHSAAAARRIADHHDLLLRHGS